MAQLMQSSADEGSGITGPNLDAHLTGNPIGAGGAGAGVPTVGHSVTIIGIGLVGLIVLGYVFRTVRL